MHDLWAAAQEPLKPVARVASLCQRGLLGWLLVVAQTHQDPPAPGPSQIEMSPSHPSSPSLPSSSPLARPLRLRI